MSAATRHASAQPELRAAVDAVTDLPISRSTLDPGNYTRAVVAVRRLLDRGPDVVHVHSPIASLVVRVAARSLPAGRRPAVIYTAHGFHFHEGGPPLANVLFRTAERVAGRWTDRLIVINDEDAAAARAARIVPARRLVRMAGVGVDFDRYDRSAVDPAAVAGVRARLGVDPSTPLFVVVGELHPNKRPADVIEALASMRDPRAVLAFVGDGVLRDKLECLVDRLGLTDRVKLAGWIDDPRPWIVAADATVLASAREGLPRATMESMALGTPAIGSAARGTVELLADDHGWLVPIGDIRALAAVMDAVAADPHAAAERAQRARTRVRERYGLEELLRRHDLLYDEVLGERSMGRP